MNRETNTEFNSPTAEQPGSLDEALAVIERQAQRIAALEARLDQQSHRPGWSRGFGLARLLKLGGRAAKSEVVDAESQSILASGLFDKAFYLKQVSDRDDFSLAKSDPLKHYLEIGGFQGLDPSAGFDSDWYLGVNPDVQNVGVNPLVHYVHHGMAEGRLPYRGAVPTSRSGLPGTSAALNKKLWAGFYHLAAPELEARCDEWFDSQAAWYLAAWDYAHGFPERALERVEQSIANGNGSVNKRALIGLVKCYTLLQDYRALADLLKDEENVRTLGNQYPYVSANAVYADDAQRLSTLNALFYRSGLVGVARRDTKTPLALDNLAPESSPPGIVFSGDIPLVSVIVPAYNAEKTLSIALEGLLAQSWPNLDILIVDDASSDDTEQVAQVFCERDSRVRYMRNVRNLGAYPTRNNGMRAAKGDFVTVHDSDDWSHPQKIERQMQPLLNDAKVVASCSNWVRVTQDLKFVGPWLLSDQFIEANHSSCLIRRRALDEMGFWDNVNVAADTEFLWRLECHFGHAALVNVLPGTPLSFALSDDSTLTRTKATHVKTIHYGLRRLYREAARWWHKKTENRPVLSGVGREFPAPLGITRGSPSAFDRMVVADFTQESDRLTLVLEYLQQRVGAGEQLCLYHWPNYQGWHGAHIADDVFEFCQASGVRFAHVGLLLSVPVVTLASEELWNYPPTQCVQLSGLKQVESLESAELESARQLMDYFLNGGMGELD